MKDSININIFPGSGCLVAECFDLHFVTQGSDFNNLLANIKEAVELAILNEDMNSLGFKPDFTLFAHFKLDYFFNERI